MQALTIRLQPFLTKPVAKRPPSDILSMLGVLNICSSLSGESYEMKFCFYVNIRKLWTAL